MISRENAIKVSHPFSEEDNFKTLIKFPRFLPSENPFLGLLDSNFKQTNERDSFLLKGQSHGSGCSITGYKAKSLAMMNSWRSFDLSSPKIRL